MTTNSENPMEETEMADGDGEQIVTMLDVLKEQQDFEDDANAVLGASDEKECTYAQGYIKRQAIYACMTCCAESKDDPSKRAGFCLACSLACHENHDLIELYTKRNFRCDCGNPKFKTPCQFTPIKLELNDENIYNQNFVGLYCNCHQPYDPESVDDEMIQCVVCEDWWHASHLDAAVPANDQYTEMICKLCMKNNEFLHDYTDLAVSVESGDVDVVKVNESALNDENLTNGTTDEEKLTNGDEAADKLTNGLTDDNTEDINAMDTSTTETQNDVLINTDNEPNKTNGEDSADAEKLDSPTDAEKSESREIVEKRGSKESIAPMDTDEAAEANKVTESENTNSENVTILSENSIATEGKTKDSNETSTDQATSIEKTDEAKSEEKAVEDEDKENVGKSLENNESQPLENTQNDNSPRQKTEALNADIREDAEKSEEETGGNKVTGDQEKLDDTIESTEAASIENADTSENIASETAVEKPNAETTDTTKTEETSQNVEMDKTSKETKKESQNIIVSKDINGLTEMESKDEAKNTEESNNTNGDDEITKEVPNLHGTENKRKISTEDDIDVSVKKPKLDEKCVRPKGVRKVCKGATFWPSHFRQKLCTCSVCIAMYKDLSVLFLTDLEDTVFAYETLGKERTAGKPNQYEKGMEALSSLGRTQQIDALTEYNKMRDKLLTFLQGFKDRKEIVTEHDIKTFFGRIKAQKRMDGVYFCG